jgi:ribosome-associated protein
MFIKITERSRKINSGGQMNPASMLVVTPKLQIPMREFTFTYARSGGPGGQNVNKVNTKATLRWPVAFSTGLPDAVRARFLYKFGGKLTAGGDLLVTSQRFRDAGRNTADCLDKLRRMLISVATPPKARRPTKPTKASIRRRLETKRRQSDRKHHRRLSGNDE